MTLNDLLAKERIDVRQTLVLRHRPMEPELRRVLPWLAAERPEVFNVYQQTQRPTAERAIARARYVASFIGHEPGRAVYVGTYIVEGSRPMTQAECEAVPAYAEMKKFGMRGFGGHESGESVLWFDLALTKSYTDWKGKLIIRWPPPERSWWRRAHRNEMAVAAILEDSLLDAHMPEWNSIDLSWTQVCALPTRWAARLSEWRGIYYIFDTADGKGYIGSAYGKTNLLGRWRGYAASGHGGNKLLRQRKPEGFRFSILQRVSPDMSADDVVRLEASWKTRLHTRQPWGLNEN